jgi:hypothetical protein
MTNLVSNTGVVGSDTTGVGTARQSFSSCMVMVVIKLFLVMVYYKYVSMTNLVSSSGVVATDVTGVGTSRRAPAAAGYSTSA